MLSKFPGKMAFNWNSTPSSVSIKWESRIKMFSLKTLGKKSPFCVSFLSKLYRKVPHQKKKKGNKSRKQNKTKRHGIHNIGGDKAEAKRTPRYF